MHSMWFNLNVKDLDRSEQFFKSLGFEIKNPEMLDKMLGITIGQTIVILMKIITSSLYHIKMSIQALMK